MRNAFKNIGLMLFVAFLGIMVISCDTTESSPVIVNGDSDDDDDPGGGAAASMIIDHTCCDISAVPRSALQDAIDNLHVCYGHTSHGSQLTTGMDNLAAFLGDDLFNYSNGGAGGTLDLHDYAFNAYGAYDLGSPDGSAWEAATRAYLADNPDVNVVIWSWCGQVSAASEAYILNYLGLMSQLELDYPSVSFVYMTGHLDGSREVGTLNIRNEQIRTFCENNDKILYDFADIESYDPDGTVNYMPMRCTDNCDYDANMDGTPDSNWATVWQNAHPGEWYSCVAAHTQPLNANRKAYAAWYLWARLGGWDGN